MKVNTISMTIATAAIAAFALISALPASAADLDQKRAPLYGGPEYARVAYPFTGLAVGVDGGGQFTSIDITAGGFSFDGISADGVIGGVNVEYLFAFNRTRLGGYVEGGFSNVNTELTGFGFSGDVLRQDHYVGFGAKGGFMITPRTLAYGRFGYDWSQWSSDIPGAPNADVGSWLLGVGIETMVAPQMSIGLGADYLAVHDADLGGTDVTSFVEDSEMGRIKARLNYRF